MGPYWGGQAEFLRVPWADFNLLNLPAGTDKETDFTLLSDIFPTGYHGTELAGVAPGKTVAVFGALRLRDPGAATGPAKQGRVEFNYGMASEKGIAIGAGQCPVKKYNRELRDLIIAGRAQPSFIVSHELPLDEAPNAYERFDAREDGWTKILLHPAA